MKKNEVIGCYNQGKHYVETCLEQIASLEQNNDKELRQVLRGTAMVEVSYKAAENFVKVCGYVINGEDGAQKLKGKLYDLKEKVKQLYDSADKHNLITIKQICDSILKEIGEVEEWANDNESDDGDNGDDDDYNDTDILPPDMKGIFNTLDDYKSFVTDCKSLCKSKQIVSRLIDTPKLSLSQGNIDILHKHLKKIGIIKVEYSQFCRLIRDELKA